MPKDSTRNTPGLGNTPTSPASTEKTKEKKKREKETCKYRWTFNNYTPELVEKLKNTLNTLGFWIFGYENCPTTGTPHLQGYIRLKSKKTWSSLVNHIGIKQVSIRECDKSEEANINYCIKDGKWESNFYKAPPKIKIINELRPFQKSLETIILNEVNEGKIHWVYDKVGQNGKTDFLRYMNVTHKVPFAYGGKCADIMNLIYNSKDYFLKSDKAAMIFNFGRDTDPNKISYKSLEQASDGAIFNSKFEAGCFVCNKPHIVVLSNCLPVLNKMTSSRWLIYSINENKELIHYNIYEDDTDVKNQCI